MDAFKTSPTPMINISLTLVLIFANIIFCPARATVINIGGLFPLTSGRGSGSQELAAVMLAISHVNDKADGIADTLLKDFRVCPQILHK